MTNRQEKAPVSEAASRRAIGILNSLSSCEWFSVDFEDNTQIRLYRYTTDRDLLPAEGFPVVDFLQAVNYYMDNRDAEIKVIGAMQSPGGMVRVWTGPENQRRVGTSIRNFRVTQILELALRLTNRPR